MGKLIAKKELWAEIAATGATHTVVGATQGVLQGAAAMPGLGALGAGATPEGVWLGA